MKKTSRILHWLLLLVPLLFTSVVMADETDLYYAQTTSANPNILFLLDNSGSMRINKIGTKTRMQVLQEAFSSVMTAMPNSLNVGLMRYGGHNSNNANGVSFPVKPVDLATDGTGSAWDIIQAAIAPGSDNLPNPTAHQPVREFLKDVTNGWSAQGYTPIVDALYEASRYYRGEPVDFGNLAPSNVRAAHPATYVTDNTLNCSLKTCNNSLGQCTGSVVAGSCSKKWESTGKCITWVTETIPPSQCCGGEVTVQVPSTCQNCVADAWDEAGKVTHQTCTDYACTKPQTSCPGGYTCGQPTTRQVCSAYEQVEVEYCKQQVCGGKRYISPIQYECQSNYLVLMSDGKPEYSTVQYPARKSAIQTLTGKGKNCGNDSPNGYKSGTCGPELTKYLLEKDQAPTLDGDQLIQTFTIGFGLDDANATNYLKALANVSDGSLAANDEASLKLAFEQVIKRVQDDVSPKLQLSAAPASQRVPAIPGKAAAKQQLAAKEMGLQGVLSTPLATEGLNAAEQKMLSSFLNPFGYWRTLAAGGFFEATDITTLIDAFNSIINKVTASASSFSSPSYQVDQNTLLAHDEYVYIPVFDRNNLPRWPGNLKKFKRDSTGKIIDANGADAVDAKGVFKDNAQDLWSSTLDGKDVTKGGTANKLPLPDNRKLYTDMSEPTSSTPVDLTAASNKLDKATTGITKALLGNTSMTDAYRDSLLDFGRGKKADGAPRYYMGDMLNGKPQIVTYGTGTTAKSYILAGSNEGYLHAIYLGQGTNPGADTSSSSGVEQWAFMPKSLLKNMDTFYQNSMPKKHVSGIDGALNVWHFQYDSNSDGMINSVDSYKTYVYFGLRQGGNEYYMLDITDITTPKVVWHITSATSGFSELGLAWSKPALAKMRVAHDSPENATTHAGDLVDVLVFGGGYDINKNDENTTTPAYTRPADSKGRNVFIVKADDGALLWSLRDDVTGAAAKLNDSIPGDIRVLDMDRNGALDRLYFSDTGGHIWRVDMDVDVSDGLPAGADTWYNYKKASLSEFANLAGSGLNQRMFFYEPDVALMQSKGKTVLTLAIGSGYRTRPLNQGDDRFYVLIDRDPYHAPSGSALTDADLASVDDTSKLGGAKTLLSDTSLKGWYYDLPNTGEKVLAPAVTFLNKVVFTTFSADAGTSTNPCESPPNSARAYVMDLFNGDAVADLDRAGGNERSVVAGVNEILDAAQLIFHNPSTADGTACSASNKADCNSQFVEIRVGKMSLPLVDNSNASNSGVAGSVDIGDILPRMFWRDGNVSGD